MYRAAGYGFIFTACWLLPLRLFIILVGGLLAWALCLDYGISVRFHRHKFRLFRRRFQQVETQGEDRIFEPETFR